MMTAVKRFLHHKDSVFVLIPLICFLFYSGELTIGYSRLDLREHTSYFKNLADAFLHWRLYVTDVGDGYDLVSYKDKFFLYWPPVPALVYLPLVSIFGLHLPDAFISILFGTLNVYLVMRILQVMAGKFAVPLALREFGLFGLFWGLGTVHFYMAMNGDVWFISQIIGQTFLLSSILIFLKTDSAGGYFLSGLFYGLAVYTRNDLVFTAVFYAFIYIAKQADSIRPVLLRNALSFLSPFIVLSLLNLWYNYARFGNVFDNGVNYHNMNPIFREDFKNWGYLSLHYVPRNFYVEVIHAPQIVLAWPFIKYEEMGFGFFWASPFFFLLIPALFSYFLLRKKLSNADVYAITGALITTSLIAFLIFTVMGTGWVQFGARYTLDFHIFLLIALVFMYKLFRTGKLFRLTAYLLVLLSIVINYCGLYLFYGLR